MSTYRCKVLIEWDATDNVWVTTVPALDGLSTFGDTRDEAIAQTREAIAGYLEALAKEGLPAPARDATVELLELEVAMA